MAHVVGWVDYLNHTSPETFRGISVPSGFVSVMFKLSQSVVASMSDPKRINEYPTTRRIECEIVPPRVTSLRVIFISLTDGLRVGRLKKGTFEDVTP